MKKYLSILIIGFILIACQDNKPFDVKVTDSINSYLKNHSAGDKFLTVESFTVEKEYTVKERKEKVNDNTLNAVRKMNETFPSEDLLAHFEKEYKFLSKQSDENTIAVYEVKFKVKKETLKNDEIPAEYNAMILNDSDLSVVFVSVYKETKNH
ncbi:MAG: hypothetical protein KGZ87_02990 [Bacteroidetes bacterium]|nr:hypothetical protein [Bacteroidota bacterium]